MLRAPFTVLWQTFEQRAPAIDAPVTLSVSCRVHGALRLQLARLLMSLVAVLLGASLSVSVQRPPAGPQRSPAGTLMSWIERNPVPSSLAILAVGVVVVAVFAGIIILGKDLVLWLFG